MVSRSHGTKLGGGALSDDLIAYHAARARGGVGLSMLEASGVHPSGPMTLNGWDDAIIPRYEALMRAVRPHGMRVFSQLNHLGSELGRPGERPWSASELTSPGSGLKTHAMSVDEIQALVHGFAAAARRAVEGGLDGVEVHCAHGYLLQQFISPHTNRREDDYGGHCLNRMRFYLEVLRAVREAIGPSIPLGTRVGPHNRADGLNVEEPYHPGSPAAFQFSFAGRCFCRCCGPFPGFVSRISLLQYAVSRFGPHPGLFLGHGPAAARRGP